MIYDHPVQKAETRFTKDHHALLIAARILCEAWHYRDGWDADGAPEGPVYEAFKQLEEEVNKTIYKDNL